VRTSELAAAEGRHGVPIPGCRVHGTITSLPPLLSGTSVHGAATSRRTLIHNQHLPTARAGACRASTRHHPQDDPHRHTLHNLREVSGRVLSWQDTELCTRSRCEARDVPNKLMTLAATSAFTVACNPGTHPRQPGSLLKLASIHSSSSRND